MKEFNLDARIDEAFKDYANYFDGWQTSEHAAPVKQLIKDVLNYCKPEHYGFRDAEDTTDELVESVYFQALEDYRNDFKQLQKELGLL